MAEPTVDKYDQFFRTLNDWAESSGWEPLHDFYGHETMYMVAEGEIEVEYLHDFGGRLYLHFDNIKDGVTGFVTRGAEKEQNAITRNVDHPYIFDADVDDPEISDYLLKEIEIPVYHDDGKLQSMLEEVDKIFDVPTTEIPT